MNVYNKLRRRFVLTCVIIVALTLAVVFGSVFAATHASAKNLVVKLLESELIKLATAPPAPPDSSPTNTDSPSVLIIRTDKDGNVYSSHNSSFSAQELRDLLTSLSNSDDNLFEYDGRTFRYASAKTADGMTFAVFDYTTQETLVRELFWVLAVLYAICLLFTACVSWLLSRKIVEPAETAMEKQKELVANVSHELKTPLTILSTNLDIVMNDPEKTVAENDKWLSVGTAQISKMNELILEMLELSRLDATDAEVTETSDLSSIVEGAILSFEASCYDKNIQLEQTVAPNIHVAGARMQLEKAVSTILDNAVKYTPEGGQISAALVKKSHAAEFTVRNSGEGIPPESIDRIFDRFYKADTARTETAAKSFGLGLSIAKSIAERCGGDIICRSEVGKYTEFVISLPIKKN